MTRLPCSFTVQVYTSNSTPGSDEHIRLVAILVEQILGMRVIFAIVLY
jgi:hypothetical protein